MYMIYIIVRNLSSRGPISLIFYLQNVFYYFLLQVYTIYVYIIFVCLFFC